MGISNIKLKPQGDFGMTFLKSIKPQIILLMLISLFILIPTASADNRVYTYDMKGMLKEIKDYKNHHKALQTDITDILKKYIPLNRPKEEVFAYLQGGNFEIRKSKNFDSKTYEEQYNAHPELEGPVFWHVLKVIFLMHYTLIIYLNVNDGVVVDIRGELQLQHL